MKHHVTSDGAILGARRVPCSAQSDRQQQEEEESDRTGFFFLYACQHCSIDLLWIFGPSLISERRVAVLRTHSSSMPYFKLVKILIIDSKY